MIPVREVSGTGLSLPELGFGAATLGNLYRPVSDAEAGQALAAGYAAGMTYIDTAPHYGHGLSERRVGDFVRGHGDAIVSTKVGRLLRPRRDLEGRAEERQGFVSPMPFEREFDYSRDGILRSWEDSLQRLGLAHVDILYIHDIGRVTHGADHDRLFAQLTRGGGFRALEELRDGGAIKAFGLGVNEWQVCLDAMDHAHLDLVLLAGRYTLLEQTALESFLPRCLAEDTSIVIGGAYNSGILATGTRRPGPLHYDYGAPPPDVLARVSAIEDVCEIFGIPLAAAALQFPLAHPAVASVILGLGSSARVDQTMDLYRRAIPVEFWGMLRERGLLRAGAPVPGAG
ncbi:aldo/keto reductase [Sphingomonas sp.]|uniref:aldo/keto reductase n=1 Tax=Sphingomonas sp. TaxID=28214 RepID=UPI000DB647B4|nr:aldo/keto reductase [Sphingomonas sp.]PZU08253.1 MAG: pyridoxal 4-dehydrogenase [Sphingomonas sp.]